MRKIYTALIALMLAVCASSIAVAEKPASMTVYLGASFPQTTFTGDDFDDDITQTGVAGQLGYLMAWQNGVTFRFDATIGVGKTDDISGEEEKASDMLYGVGLGYTFFREQRWNLTLTGDVGVGMYRYAYAFEQTVSSNVSGYNYSVTSRYDWDMFGVYFALGASAAASFRFTDHLGAYAHLGIYKILGGNEYDSLKVTPKGGRSSSYSDTLPIDGNIRLQPAIGLCWKFY